MNGYRKILFLFHFILYLYGMVPDVPEKPETVVGLRVKGEDVVDVNEGQSGTTR